MTAVEARRYADGDVVSRGYVERQILTTFDDCRADARSGVLRIAVENVTEHAPDGQIVRVLTFNETNIHP